MDETNWPLLLSVTGVLCGGGVCIGTVKIARIPVYYYADRPERGQLVSFQEFAKVILIMLGACLPFIALLAMRLAGAE